MCFILLFISYGMFYSENFNFIGNLSAYIFLKIKLFKTTIN